MVLSMCIFRIAGIGRPGLSLGHCPGCPLRADAAPALLNLAGRGYR